MRNAFQVQCTLQAEVALDLRKQKIVSDLINEAEKVDLGEGDYALYDIHHLDLKAVVRFASRIIEIMTRAEYETTTLPGSPLRAPDGPVNTPAPRARAVAPEELSVSLPHPTILRRALRLRFWCEQERELVAAAGSVRALRLDPAGPMTTWLYCYGDVAEEVEPRQMSRALAYLLPVGCIIEATVGPRVRLGRIEGSPEKILLVHPEERAPSGSIPLADLQRLVAGLLDESSN